MSHLRTILKLKRTLSPQGLPLGYREIGRILGVSHTWAKHQVRERKNCCPQCLRPLVLPEVEK